MRVRVRVCACLCLGVLAVCVPGCGRTNRIATVQEPVAGGHVLAAGSYGVVAEALDHSRDPPRRVAIKQVKDVFSVFENAKRIYREIRLLRSLDHVNVIKIVHIQKPK